MLKLTVAQVDLREGCVRLEVGTSKTGEGRTFYMTTALRTLLEQQLASLDALKKKGVICPYVFHRDGAAIKDFRTSWKDACDAAGYPGKLFHDLRRTAVRNLERAGVPRSTAMQRWDIRRSPCIAAMPSSMAACTGRVRLCSIRGCSQAARNGAASSGSGGQVKEQLTSVEFTKEFDGSHRF